MKTGGILFDVFQHPDGKRAVGFGKDANGKRYVVDVLESNGSSRSKCQEVSADRLAGLLSQKLRDGFVANGPRYFDAIGGQFTLIHPELSWGGEEWILAAEPGDTRTGVALVVKSMERVAPDRISRVEIEAWAKRNHKNDTFLVAFTDMPIWSLALAHVAMLQGWVMRANPIMKGDTPGQPPDANPVCWDHWLSQQWPESKVRHARQALGLTMANLGQSSSSALIDQENWSSLI